MKNTIIGVGSTIMLIMIILIISTVYGRSARKSELELAMDYSMEQALNACVKTDGSAPGTDEQLAALFAESMTEQIHSNSALQIEVINVDVSKHLLSAKCTLFYNHLNGRTGSVSLTKTVITEQVYEDNTILSINYTYPFQDDKSSTTTPITNEVYVNLDDKMDVAGMTGNCKVTQIVGIKKNYDTGMFDYEDVNTMTVISGGSEKTLRVGEIYSASELKNCVVSNTKDYDTIYLLKQ